MIMKSSLITLCVLALSCTHSLAQTAKVTSFGASQVDTYTGLILASDGNFYAVSAAGASADYRLSPKTLISYIRQVLEIQVSSNHVIRSLVTCCPLSLTFQDGET
jgi:hypothetical protein